MKVFKYPLIMITDQGVKLPKGAEVLSVQVDNKTEMPALWAKVNPSNTAETRAIFILATGQPVPQKANRFISTFQSGQFVWHVFEHRG